jgi:hypothetical protein
MGSKLSELKKTRKLGTDITLKVKGITHLKAGERRGGPERC